MWEIISGGIRRKAFQKGVKELTHHRIPTKKRRRNIMKTIPFRHLMLALLSVPLVLGFAVPGVFAQCPAGQVPVFPGADDCILDPGTIDKYYIPLVIPPVMKNNGTADSYDVAVRQFGQQILPGGLWATLAAAPPTAAFPATTVWSYGPAADPTPAVAPDPNSQFNYPAYTFETFSFTPVSVRWINDLVDPVTGDCLPHILPLDQTLHWANPPMDCRMGPARTDCAGQNPAQYTGPVPIVTHVHGAHVDPHSDGYPEAWWLPACNQAASYAQSGTLFDDATGLNDGTTGYADYWYRQDQPATTLWYHDHSLGMTRNNVYAGPAGFWLIRGGQYDQVTDSSTGKMGRLPGPFPGPNMTLLELNIPGETVRNKIREIPIVIQDRDFEGDGSQLWYPDNRARFEDLNPAGGTAPVLDIDFVPNSDVAPVWNPEAFFNVMVVNGVAWPSLDVAQAQYRFRFLNGCNSRFLWLKFDNADVEAYQIGAEQGFLPAPVSMNNDLDGSGDGTAQILMALAERADVIVDFRNIPDGTTIELINIGPDEPFGGGTPGIDFDPADPSDSGKVMRFVVNAALNGFGQTDPMKRNGKPNPQAATDPANLVLNAEPALGPATVTRQVSLNELDSEQVCVIDVAGSLIQAFDSDTGDPLHPEDECEDSILGDVGAEPFGPLEALLGTVDLTGAPEGIPLKWTDDSGIDKLVPLMNGATVTVNVTENPALGAIEDWEIYNFTMDAHPIHLHLVRFAVIERRPIGDAPGTGSGPLPWETGFKDTVIAYPDEITTVRAHFDIEGLYVWHCHIVEHEDNEMMRPYIVGLADAPPPPP
jgi:FtsP/CotA-like multicopper oxidase with cupredoxin domain